MRPEKLICETVQIRKVDFSAFSDKIFVFPPSMTPKGATFRKKLGDASTLHPFVTDWEEGLC